MNIRFIKVPGLFLVAALLFAGCQSTPPQPEAPLESSVKPGINAEYLKPDLDINLWVTRLERESREIFKHRETIVQTLAIQAGQTVADIGAGTGIFTPYFSHVVGNDGLVYAVDIVPEFLEHIEARAKESNLRNVITVLCTERSVQLPDNSVDLAFLSDVYHHFEYPQSSLQSIHRALRSNGELVLIDFKRVPGESSEWVLNHVRAGQETFTAEIEAAGFRQVKEYPILEENYMVRFRKVNR